MFLSKTQYFLRVVNKLYILLFFFLVPLKYTNYLTIGYLAVSLVLILFSALSGETITKKSAFRIFAVFISLLFVIVLSKYSKINSVLVFAYLVICYFSYPKDSNNSNISAKSSFDWFYYIGLISISIKLLLKLIATRFSLNDFELGTGAWDNNVSAVALFCFFVYCDMRHPKKIVWIVLALLTVFFSRSSRGALLMAALFVFLKFTLLLTLRKKTSFQKRMAENKSISQKKVLAFVVFTLFFVVLFSFFWTYVVSSKDVVEYHAGLNDGSNAVRFRANVYVIKQLFSDWRFIFYGYDNNIQTMLGDVDSLYFIRFEGYRLVQSHNSFLNMIIKNGLLFSLSYYVAVFSLFKPCFKIKNIPYLLPLFMMSMFLHSLIITDFLLFFLVSLNADYPETAFQNRVYLINESKRKIGLLQ